MSLSFLRSCTAALALTVAGAGLAAHAAEPAPDAPPPPAGAQAPGHPHADWKKGHARHARMGERPAAWVPGLGPLPQSLVDKLQLGAEQKAQLEQARTQQRELFDAMRQARQASSKQLSEQIAAGKLDPHALAAQREQGQAKFRQQADAVQKQWLALWDGLNPAQRQEVTQFLQSRQAAMAERRQHREPREQGGRGEHRPPAAG